VGIAAYDYGPGNIDIFTAAGTVIDSGGSGIHANNSDAAVPNSSEIVITAYGTITPGQILSGDGNPPAGILAGYESSSDAADDNVHGNVTIDDYASITAPSGTDGIRGYNYGTGTVTVTAELDADITAGRYGLAARGHDGGDVSVINYGSVTAPTAINANTTGTGTIDIDNHGTITGAIVVGNASAGDAPFVGQAMIDNEAGALWNVLGDSSFTGSSQLQNFGSIDSNGAALVSGLSSIDNAGTIEVQSGSLKLDAALSGTGTLTVDAKATLELTSAVSSGQTVTFSSTTGMLVLDQAQNFHGLVAGLGTSDGTQAGSDQIDLANINFHSADFSEQFNAATDTLSVSDGANTADRQLHQCQFRFRQRRQDDQRGSRQQRHHCLRPAGGRRRERILCVRADQFGSAGSACDRGFCRRPGQDRRQAVRQYHGSGAADRGPARQRHPGDAR
jgi:hypothetical protein